MKSIGLLGCGNVATLIAKAGIPLECPAVYDQIPTRSERLASQLRSYACQDFDEFIQQSFDTVVELASIDAVHQFGPQILEADKDLIALSVGAFADKGFKDQMLAIAQRQGRTIRIPSGAIFGLDNLKIGRIGAIDHIRLRTTKPPEAFKLKLTESTCLFDGDAAECIKAYPKNVNVAAAISLAANKAVQLELWADPQATRNRHEVLVEGPFGQATIEVINEPSPDNPATSQLAAFSVLALLQAGDPHLLVGN